MNVALIENEDFYNNTPFFSNEVKNEYIENVLQSEDLKKASQNDGSSKHIPSFWVDSERTRHDFRFSGNMFSFTRLNYIVYTCLNEKYIEKRLSLPSALLKVVDWISSCYVLPFLYVLSKHTEAQWYTYEKVVTLPTLGTSV